MGESRRKQSTIGITDYAQNALGTSYSWICPSRAALSAGDAPAVVESVKAASDICPGFGTIIEATELENSPSS